MRLFRIVLGVACLLRIVIGVRVLGASLSNSHRLNIHDIFVVVYGFCVLWLKIVRSTV